MDFVIAGCSGVRSIWGMKTGRPLALVPLLFALVADPTQAQRPDTVRLPVEPQVELFTIITRPVGEGPHPVVLVRSPYRARGGSTAWLAERLVPHGYAVVEQDVRGTGGSSGTFIPFRFDVQDGTATLDWLAQQSWAASVGLWGVSYLGWAAYALAETGHPAVGAMAVGSAWAEMDPFLFPGGAFHLSAHLPWLMGFAGGAGVPSQDEFDRIARTLPLAAVLPQGEGGMAPAMPPYRWEEVAIPVLHYTGWHDYIYRDALHGYERLRASQGPSGSRRLIVGPWSHNGEKTGQTRVADVDYGPAAAAGLDSVAAWTRRFFDDHLRGIKGSDAPVRVFIMGENVWRDFADWPPPGAETTAWHLGPDGRLQNRPQRRARSTRFRYDPENPMPTLGGVNSHFFPGNVGPLDQTPLDSRQDLASFLSPSLERPLVLTGPMRAVLFLEADAPSTDVAVKLIAVGPDGTARLIEDGIRRLPALQPGMSEITVDLGQRGLRLEPGSRLRLDVTGGSFPKYDRNPNTGEEPLTATALRPVTITLHHGGTRPARLEIVTLAD
jgi:uncharacterized protein